MRLVAPALALLQYVPLQPQLRPARARDAQSNLFGDLFDDSKLKAQFMGAEAGQREAKRFTDLTLGQEREMTVRQRERLKHSRT